RVEQLFARFYAYYLFVFRKSDEFSSLLTNIIRHVGVRIQNFDNISRGIAEENICNQCLQVNIVTREEYRPVEIA
ncbi:hypothetical protein PFISCL1PPCAC_1149, partial [Pristionchus fissidentatus]